MLISHLLGEILAASDRVVVMRDGRVVARGAAGEFTRDSLVAAMGNVAEAGTGAVGGGGSGARPSRPAAHPGQTAAADGQELVAYPGEVVGLAGLAGQGQSEHAACTLRRGAAPAPGRRGRRQRRAGRRRPADRRHLPALVDRREHQHRLACGR